MTTLTRHETMPVPDEAERVFAAPWEAKTFALVVALHERGLFPWRQFHEALAGEVAKEDVMPEPESGSSSVYYKHWTAAAEAVLTELGILDLRAIEDLKVRIRSELEAGDHVHGAAAKPVAVAPAL